LVKSNSIEKFFSEDFLLEKVLKDGRDIPLDDLESAALFFQNQNHHLLAGKFFMFAQNYDRV
jgi:hypothetical protein